MALIPQPFIDDLLARVDIVELIGSRLHLKKAGSNFSALCPFHNEKTPSFTVSPAKQFFHCFGCGAHGSAIGFLMQFEHLEFVEAIEKLAAQLGIEIPRNPNSAAQVSLTPLHELMEKLAKFYHKGKQDCLDGLTAEFPNYWFNVRTSNTEPLLRITIEARDKKLASNKLKQIKKIIKNA